MSKQNFIDTSKSIGVKVKMELNSIHLKCINCGSPSWLNNNEEIEVNHNLTQLNIGKHVLTKYKCSECECNTFDLTVNTIIICE